MTTTATAALTINTSPSVTVRDENTVAQAILTTLQADFALQGISVNVAQGSDYYRLAFAIARQLVVTDANNVVSVDDFMPDSAAIGALTRWMAVVNMAPRPAFGATGFVTITCSQPSPIPGGPIGTAGAAILVDALNQQYQVTQSGVYATGKAVPIAAISVGKATEHVNGDTLTWVTAPPFCNGTVTVGTPGANDGLVNGGDAEDVESARARFFQRLANPMGGGNWSQVAEVAANSYGAIQGAAVYPAANGPGTTHVAVFGYASNLQASNAKNRDIDASTMSGKVAPYVANNLAEHAEIVTTTVENTPVDVSVGLVIPSAPNASPPGPGGGWLDAQPWPYNATLASNFKCIVTAVTSTTQVTCDAPTAPIDGVSRIAFLDPSTWQIFSARVISHTGTSGAYALVLDAPMLNITTGAYLWPQSANQQVYVSALLSAFAAMGPGEKTNAAGLLPRASRKPLPSTLFPYSLGDVQLAVITRSSQEVIASQWLYRSKTTPDLPGAITDPPRILVPQNIGLYRLEE